MVWLHFRIKNDGYPNVQQLALEFELSSRTAQRTIANFRDRWEAPLEYDRGRKGYYYLDKEYEFPLAVVSQEEILAILLARNLLDRSAGGYISRAIQKFSRRLLAGTSFMGLSRESIEQAFSAVWNLYSPAQAQVFRRVSHALLNNSVLCLDYTSPATGRTSSRKIEPHHLQHYTGSWVLIAFCRTRQDWRKFYLSRMNNVSLTRDSFAPRPRQLWQYQVEDSFGIFQKEANVPVVLRFNSFRSRWVREQIWHPAQEMRELEDGSLELEFPVADFREIKMKILSFGADLKVISPKELKHEVAAEIEKMSKVYKM